MDLNKNKHGNLTTDAVAKILATENITVIRRNEPTASFDIKKRVLTLPMWSDVSQNIEDLLIGHEVGHALYTTPDLFECIKKDPNIKYYINVLEDVRVEKFIRDKYFGYRKIFAEGYQEMHESDFFGSLYVDPAQLSLIDKINMYYKPGLDLKFFDNEELGYLREAKNTSTCKDVVELAYKLYKKEEEEQQKIECNGQGDSDCDNEDNEDESDNDDKDDKKNENKEKDGDKNEKESNNGNSDESDDDKNSSGSDSKNDEKENQGSSKNNNEDDGSDKDKQESGSGNNNKEDGDGEDEDENENGGGSGDEGDNENNNNESNQSSGTEDRDDDEQNGSDNELGKSGGSNNDDEEENEQGKSNSGKDENGNNEEDNNENNSSGGGEDNEDSEQSESKNQQQSNNKGKEENQDTSRPDKQNNNNNNNNNNRQNQQNKSTSAKKTKLPPQTQKNFDERVSSKVSPKANSTCYIDIMDRRHEGRPIVVGYKKICNELFYNADSIFENDDIIHMKEVSRNFHIRHKDALNYMVKEFEMKKSAEEYKRREISQTGVLDPKKLWAYKIKDDLFKRITIVKEGKNHGMMILIDWSSSMSSVFTDMIVQVVNLVMFCRKVGIPYKVYAFTNRYGGLIDADDEDRYIFKKNKEYVDGCFDSYNIINLLEFFTPEMTQEETYTMMGCLLSGYILRNSSYDLGMTPLNNALVWIIENIESFIDQHRIEKMNFITVTDGESHILHGKYLFHTRQKIDSYNKDMLYVDEVSKRTYQFSNFDGASQTKTLLKILKDRYNYIKSIGFYITKGEDKEIVGAYHNNVSVERNDNIIAEIKKDFKDKDFCVYEGKESPRDQFIILHPRMLKVGNREYVPSDSGVSPQDYSDFMKAKRNHRIVLRNFIDNIT